MDRRGPAHALGDDSDLGALISAANDRRDPALLRPGRYACRIEAADFEPATCEVVVERDQLVHARVELIERRR